MSGTHHHVPEPLRLQRRFVSNMEAALLPRAIRLDLVIVLGEHGLLIPESCRLEVRLVVVRLVAHARLLTLYDVLRK